MGSRTHTNASGADAGLDPGAAAELAQILTQLGPVADRLGSRAVIAQYEADIGDPALTRRGTSIAGSTGPLPRFLPVRDILRINFNMHGLVPAVAVPNRFARSVRMPTDDNLASTVPYAPTLRAALNLVARYGDAAVPWYRRSVRRAGNALHISYGPIVPLGRIEPLATEIALATIHRIVETFVGDRIANARIHFARAPVSDPLVLAGRFSCPIEVGGDDNFMAIPAPWGDMPSPYHDPHAWAEGEARCDADIRLLTAAPLVSRVRAHVEPALDGGHVALLAETARHLGISARSLVRALAHAGTTHHAIVDDARKARALDLLAKPRLPMPEIAEQLGFTDQSNFGRKCRAWFGDSPGRLRERLVAMQPTEALHSRLGAN
ncbi:AraC family transcriptional regulator [Polymorphobacter arshaanensis]|uniref:AraC family transcriptional regulator n=1 Tax=Glacieibacterium arshaanense TaxID=2511025 RepID=A0A4Y9ENA5_9SPHN|nr:AraC family transcriptional regulator [Polymorphobacter arshaanensis]TFU03555.1 AraC family transcriptional regulator [Polymorphobacter arshaanensis]